MKRERGREGAGVCAEGEGAGSVCVCMCVCSQGFDTAIQALRLPWCRPPYMAIGVKEQREWAVQGSAHTLTQEGCGGSLSLLRDAESLTQRPPKKHPNNARLNCGPTTNTSESVSCLLFVC